METLKIEVRKEWSQRNAEFFYRVYKNGEWVSSHLTESAAIEVAESLLSDFNPEPQTVWSREIELPAKSEAA